MYQPAKQTVIFLRT